MIVLVLLGKMAKILPKQDNATNYVIEKGKKIFFDNYLAYKIDYMA